MEVTLLMPCLNEARTVLQCIKEARSLLNRLGIEGEILVADNGSTDESRAICLDAGARVLHVPDLGYGLALQAGLAAANGTFIIFADADASYDFREADGILQKLREGCDLVVGCRFPKWGGRIEPGAMPWLNRWFGNPVLTWIGRLLFGSPLHDFHCGMRGLRKTSLMELDLRCPGMEFASEMIAKAALLGLRVGEAPVTLRPDGRSRPPHLRRWRDGFRHLRLLFFLFLSSELKRSPHDAGR